MSGGPNDKKLLVELQIWGIILCGFVTMNNLFHITHGHFIHCWYKKNLLICGGLRVRNNMFKLLCFKPDKIWKRLTFECPFVCFNVFTLKVMMDYIELPLCCSSTICWRCFFFFTYSMSNMMKVNAHCWVTEFDTHTSTISIRCIIFCLHHF